MSVVRHLLSWTIVVCFMVPVVSCVKNEPIMREITSVPSSAKITYSAKGDNQWTELGPAPIIDTIQEGATYPVGLYRAEKEGFRPETKSVMPSVGEKKENIKLDFKLKPVTAIRLAITSTPSDATIFFGTDKNDITKQLGTAPYRQTKTDASSEEKPSWEKGFYKAQLNGYRPKVIASEQKSEDLTIHFDLEPVPQPPAPPEFVYPDVKGMVYKPIFIDCYRNPDAEISAATPIIVMAFKENTGQDLGMTVSDALILKLQRRGMVVLEREYVEKAINDLNLPAQAQPAPVAAQVASATPGAILPPTSAKRTPAQIELIKQISEPLKTRFFLIGTVTKYSSGKEEVSVIPIISEAEQLHYQKEYDAYLTYYKSERLPFPQIPKTLQEWDLEYRNRAKTTSIEVARVAITAKLLDVKSGKAVWTGMVSVTESGIQSGLNKVLDSIVESLSAREESGEVKKK